MTMGPEEARAYLAEVAQRRREGHRHEYSEVFMNIRHYSALRFAALTIFVASTGAIVGAVLNTKGNAATILALKVLGVVLAVIFGAFDRRIDAYLLNLNGRARQLEKALEYEQARSLGPSSKWQFRIEMLVSTATLYIVTLLFWIFWLIVP